MNDSRHHGLSISADGEKLCVAGTMDNYATIVDRKTLTAGKLISAGKPYWATRSPDGRSCVISESETDVVTVIDFATGNKVLSVPVGIIHNASGLDMHQQTGQRRSQSSMSEKDSFLIKAVFL